MGNKKVDGVFHGRFSPNQERLLAKTLGLKVYHSSKKCQYGHSWRYVAGYKCHTCKTATQRAAWPERSKSRIFTQEQLESSKERSRRWRKENPKHRNALTANYEKRVRLQTPKWADIKKIVEFYKSRPENVHVDHIIPLRGRNVSGLHVLENLQYLSPVENYRKNRKYEVTHG